ncbi:MAG TPA: DUF4349 domain-containing protein [Cytophagaceae bacterium]
MKRYNYLFLIWGFLFLLSCSNSDHSYHKESYAPMEEASVSDTTYSENILSSSAAIVNKKDTLRKFVRTADLKFRVKDVIKTTYQIEDITHRLGGFVIYTNLKSDIEYRTQTQISKDSLLETTHYTIVNSMKLRVPNYRLDTTLKAIGKLVDYMDYRIIQADDAGLEYLSHTLTQNRVKKSESRVNKLVEKDQKDLWESVDIEDKLYYRQEQADDALIAKYRLKDQIEFSTVSLHIYQKQATQNELVANNKNIKAYEASFGVKVKDAFYSGWKVLEALILFLIEVWWLILTGVVVLLVYKKYRFTITGKSKS